MNAQEQQQLALAVVVQGEAEIPQATRSAASKWAQALQSGAALPADTPSTNAARALTAVLSGYAPSLAGRFVQALHRQGADAATVEAGVGYLRATGKPVPRIVPRWVLPVGVGISVFAILGLTFALRRR